VEVFWAQEVARNSLTLSSDQPHFANGSFDMDRLLKTLENLLKSALRDRYKGLWAVGDMTWELGMEKDPARLLEYEWRLEKMFHQHPELSGICQYHSDTLPRSLLRQSLLVHRRSLSTRRSHSLARTTCIPMSAPTNRITTSISTQPSPDSASQATSLRHSYSDGAPRARPGEFSNSYSPPTRLFAS
jgi:hypothetical protein